MTAPAAAPVLVSCWGELRGERKKIPGALRVLVDGQHAGAVWRQDASWHAVRQARVLGAARETEHASCTEALRAVLRSGFARHLGARAASRVHWTARAGRLADRTGSAPAGKAARR